MIEVLLAVGPMDELEVTADMLAVTSRAISFLLGGLDDAAVVARAGSDFLSNQLMTLGADEDRLSRAEDMAFGALQRTVKIAVCVGERTRGQLRPAQIGQAREEGQYAKERELHGAIRFGRAASSSN
ncbi:MAG: hypothetical protein R2748_16370 [Bryobacterales bacterium]